jgi:hypothetical protein
MPRRDDDFDDDDRPRRRPRDDDDDRPVRRRRRRYDDDDDFDSPPPRKKSNIGLILGIVLGVLFLVCGGGGVLLYFAFRGVSGAAERVTSSNNMKEIALTVMEYETRRQEFPTNSYSPDGKPLLSWRVHILQYMGPSEQALYQRFKLNEPWDSVNNRPLLDQMPLVYAAPADRSGRVATGNKTYYRGFSNPGAIFERRRPGQRISIPNITDGMSNTILVVEAGDPVEWTKPDDLDAAPGKPFPKLGGVRPTEDTVLVGFLDGSVRPIRKSIPEANWRAAVTYAGNDIANLE